MSEHKNNVPKLRFPEFTEPWEQRKLGDVTKSYSGGTPSVDKREYYNGHIPFIRSAEINSDTVLNYFYPKSGYRTHLLKWFTLEIFFMHCMVQQAER